jgi:hypothetical protein
MRSWRDGSGSGCGHFLGPPKLRAVSPDAVQDHSDLAGNSNARLLRSNALGQPCPPSFERGPTLHLREEDIGGLVQARSSEPISAFRDVALPICFSGLISSRCQPEVGSYIAGPSEPAGLIDRRTECQSRHWPDARDRQEASQGWIIADETADFLCPGSARRSRPGCRRADGERRATPFVHGLRGS